MTSCDYLKGFSRQELKTSQSEILIQLLCDKSHDNDSMIPIFIAMFQLIIRKDILHNNIIYSHT